MSGYTPLFSSIVASTIWRESKETKIVWITMLAMSDCRGVVEGSIPGLADLAKVTIDECKSALFVLMSPDEYSRTKEHDGRRIEECDGGWLILNHAKFREKSRDRTAYMRNYRNQCNQNVTNVTASNQTLPPVTDTNSYSNSDSNTKEKEDKSASTSAKPKSKHNATDIFFDGSHILNVTEDDLNGWVKAYPAINIQNNIYRAAEWLKSNPTKRKKNVRRFLVNWFARAQERGGDKIVTKPREPWEGAV